MNGTPCSRANLIPFSAPSKLRYGLHGEHQSPSQRRSSSSDAAPSRSSVDSHSTAISQPSLPAASFSALLVLRWVGFSGLKSPIIPIVIWLATTPPLVNAPAPTSQAQV